MSKIWNPTQAHRLAPRGGLKKRCSLAGVATSQISAAAISPVSEAHRFVEGHDRSSSRGKRSADEQITCALRQAEGGTPVADVCRQIGVSEARFNLCKKECGNLGLTELRELRQLRDENTRLKRLVADLTLDKHTLGEVVRKKL